MEYFYTFIKSNNWRLNASESGIILFHLHVCEVKRTVLYFKGF